MEALQRRAGTTEAKGAPPRSSQRFDGVLALIKPLYAIATGCDSKITKAKEFSPVFVSCFAMIGRFLVAVVFG